MKKKNRNIQRTETIKYSISCLTYTINKQNKNYRNVKFIETRSHRELLRDNTELPRPKIITKKEFFFSINETKYKKSFEARAKWGKDKLVCPEDTDDDRRSTAKKEKIKRRKCAILIRPIAIEIAAIFLRGRRRRSWRAISDERDKGPGRVVRAAWAGGDLQLPSKAMLRPDSILQLFRQPGPLSELFIIIISLLPACFLPPRSRWSEEKSRSAGKSIKRQATTLFP